MRFLILKVDRLEKKYMIRIYFNLFGQSFVNVELFSTFVKVKKGFPNIELLRL